MPRFSIVTVSFNQGNFLPRCISSVRGQDFDDYEHIVVDAGSTDGSRDYLSALDDHRVRLVFKEDSGPAQGLNNGIAGCRGEIFLYLNADDELAPSALSMIHDLFLKNANIDVVVGNGWILDETGKPLEFVRSDRFSPLRYAFSVGTVLQQATSFRRELIDRGLRFDETNRYTWDTKLLFDALELGARFLYVDETLGYFRMHSESITSSGRYDARIRESIAVLIRGSVGPVWRTIAMAGSLPARCVKFSNNFAWRMKVKPTFPGLVVSTEEIRS